MRFDDFLEVFLTEKTHRTLASGGPACPVSSGRSVHDGVKRADAGQGAPARSVSFCGGPDAADRTLAKHRSASSHANVAMRSEVREDRTLACVRCWCIGRVRSTFSRSGPSLESTG
jgi:hypothetical protein